MRKTLTATAAVTFLLAVGVQTAGASDTAASEATGADAVAQSADAPTDSVDTEVSARVPITTPGMLTILFGRTQWVSVDRQCDPLPNSVNLGRVATLLKQRGVSGVGNVVVKRQGVERSCFSNYVIGPSWNDLTQLRTQYGWTFTSAGMNYANMTTLTPTQQHAEACGSVGALARRGHNRAWGLFAYPNNKYTSKIQSQVVKKCFAFGRQYGDTSTARTSATTWPNWQTTVSVNGGRCADTSLPCSQGGARTAYMPPGQLIPKTRVRTNSWTTLQFYRFVTGTSTPGSSMQWNCTGPESAHWTSDAEIYCIRDFLRIVDAIPDKVKVTDPATVATLWGVEPSN